MWSNFDEGKLDINLFVSNFIKENYAKIQKDYSKNIIQNEIKSFMFQWDNYQKHKSKLALEFYEKNKIDMLE